MAILVCLIFSVDIAMLDLKSESEKPLKTALYSYFYDILYTVQPVLTGPCTNRNPVYTVIIIWSRINYTQDNTN